MFKRPGRVGDSAENLLRLPVDSRLAGTSYRLSGRPTVSCSSEDLST